MAAGPHFEHFVQCVLVPFCPLSAYRPQLPGPYHPHFSTHPTSCSHFPEKPSSLVCAVYTLPDVCFLTGAWPTYQGLHF